MSGKKQRLMKSAVVSALRDAWGVKTTAADALGVSRQSVHNYLNRYPDIEQSVEKWVVAELEKIMTEKHGNIFEVTNACPLSRQTIYVYMDKYPHLKTIRQNRKDDITDFARMTVEEGVLAKDPDYTKFWLRTQAKDDGWSLNSAITHKGDPNSPIHTVIEVVYVEKTGDDDE